MRWLPGAPAGLSGPAQAQAESGAECTGTGRAGWDQSQSHPRHGEPVRLSQQGAVRGARLRGRRRDRVLSQALPRSHHRRWLRGAGLAARRAQRPGAQLDARARHQSLWRSGPYRLRAQPDDPQGVQERWADGGAGDSGWGAAVRSRAAGRTARSAGHDSGAEHQRGAHQPHSGWQQPGAAGQRGDPRQDPRARIRDLAALLLPEQPEPDRCALLQGAGVLRADRQRNGVRHLLRYRYHLPVPGRQGRQGGGDRVGGERHRGCPPQRGP